MSSKVERNTKARDKARTPVVPWDTGGTQYLYFVRIPDGPVKIGRAMDVNVRVKTLQCASPWPLELIGVVRDGGRLEGEWHIAFHKQRMEGEWFSWSDDLATAIAKAIAEPGWAPSTHQAIEEILQAMREAA